MIFTKCSLIWDERRRISHSLKAESIKREVDESLARLGVETLDLYQVHWPDRKVPLFGEDLRGYVHYGADHIPIEESLGALQKLVDAGKVKALGVSNETSWGLMRYVSANENKGLPRIHSNQNAYNRIS